MRNIKNFMAGDHRQCDELLVTAEQAVASRSWQEATAAFAGFQHAVLQHFTAEESVLFPAFEEKTGMLSGPTQVMRGEHVQMRELMAAAHAALLAQDADDYAGNAETLFIMMQQHNVKEENVLYPMCDQLLSAQVDALLPRLHDQIQTPAD
jgi:hemerythrin-like domain-containing protein